MEHDSFRRDDDKYNPKSSFIYQDSKPHFDYYDVCSKLLKFMSNNDRVSLEEDRSEIPDEDIKTKFCDFLIPSKLISTLSNPSISSSISLDNVIKRKSDDLIEVARRNSDMNLIRRTGKILKKCIGDQSEL